MRQVKAAGISFVMIGLLFSCAPEGTELLSSVARDPCLAPDANLSDGLQTGDEALAVFNCLNRTGELAPLVPLMDALAQEPGVHGSLLDDWVNAGLEADRDVTLEQLAGSLERLRTTLQSESVEDALLVSGDVLQSGLAEPSMRILSTLAGALLELKTAQPDAYAAYFVSFAHFLCPERNSDGLCQGDAQVLENGLRQSGLLSSLQSTEPSGKTLAEQLVNRLRPTGSPESDLELLSGLGEAAARAGTAPMLLDALGRHIPALWGDYPFTAEAEVGYPSFNENDSALFGLMNLFADEDSYAAFEHYLEADVRIMTHCYFDDGNGGYLEVPIEEGACETGHGPFAEQNPASSGFAQLMRLVKAVNVGVDPSSPTGQLLLTFFRDSLGTTYEISDSTNIATLILEYFAQLPPEDIIAMVQAAATNAALITMFNELFATTVQMDDLQALRAAVEDEGEHGGVGAFLSIMRAFNHAAKAQGICGLDTFKDLLVNFYDTQMLTAAYPYFLEFMLRSEEAVMTGPTREGEPASASPVDEGVLVMARDLAPGGPYHESVTMPLFALLHDLRGEGAVLWVPPLATGLTRSSQHFTELFWALGTLGENALIAYQASPEARTGLDALSPLLSSLAAGQTQKHWVTALSVLLEDTSRMDLWTRTLASEAVVTALTEPQELSQESPIQWLARGISEGRVEGLLDILGQSLEKLEAAASDK